jgi:N-acetylmuramoyl-L-alanine amidase
MLLNTKVKNKKRINILLFEIFLISILFFAFPNAVFAREGDCGYEGGISSGEVLGKTIFDYQEYFLGSGTPILMKGTVSLKKSAKQNILTSTYNYNLKNTAKSATLTRQVVLTTVITTKSNGQKIEDTTISKPVESFKIKNQTYTLTSYEFTRTNIIDPWPAINYYAGNFNSKKTYRTGSGTGATASVGSIVVDTSGEFYGYDQYWGCAEVITLNSIVSSEQKIGETTDKWGATAKITISTSTAKQLSYVQSKPSSISFSGGYVQKQFNNSIAEIDAKFPEFDSKGVSLDKVNTINETLKLESFPSESRLPIINLKHIRGHWSENDATILFSLEIFKGNSSTFNPDTYIKRDEFASIIMNAAKEVPLDPAFSAKTTTSKPKVTPLPNSSSFIDVPLTNLYFSQIEQALKKNLMAGKSGAKFGPNDTMTVAEVITVFIRALGLENLAPNPISMTSFKDDKNIPSYARTSVYVAEKIGLIQDSEKGYLNPNDKVTRGKAALLINDFIEYMRTGIRKDYKEKLIGY